jgi:hypothetical protein
MSRPRSLALLALALTLASAAPAGAQLRYGGFAAAGRGSVEGTMFDPHFTLAAGYQTSLVSAGGAELGVRASMGYARLRRDRQAHLDSLGLADGRIRGGKVSSWDYGGDVVLAIHGGPVTVHGFYGLHYFQDFYEEAHLVASEDAPEDSGVRFRPRARYDFGTARGAGVTLGLGRGQGVFAEWYEGGGYDPWMLQLSGVRFGLSWQH